MRLNNVQCYAPTNNSGDEIKNKCYDRLQDTINSFPDRDVDVLMGDFNAKVSNDNRGYEVVMEKQGLSVMNKNGERLANHCATSSLVIGGTIFAHRNIHLATWISPEHNKKPERPYMYIEKVQKDSRER